MTRANLAKASNVSGPKEEGPDYATASAVYTQAKMILHEARELLSGKGSPLSVASNASMRESELAKAASIYDQVFRSFTATLYSVTYVLNQAEEILARDHRSPEDMEELSDLEIWHIKDTLIGEFDKLRLAWRPCRLEL